MKILKDSPIKSSQADLFGRGRIVESIVETVKNRSREGGECYTIGIYGKWGEGKTSLLNMICEKIVGENDIKIIHFNPWLFKDQESLLLDFFKALQKGQISRAFVNKIKQYGPLVSLGLSGLMNIAIPGAGVGTTLHNSFKEVTNAISNINVDIRELKNDLNEKIKLSKKHLLIMIDDVDRLDNEELHAVFKLIRQNADFVNTTYIIAMDVDMVAKSIGQRFEDRNEQSGKHFLEKIVQVPIYLPKIQSAHLNKFLESCLFTQFQKLFSLGTIKSTPSLEDLKELLYRYVFPLFTTVREAILYSNSIAFILPMVYQEVNLGDLCLLEVLKLFHPSAYNTIKASRHILTGSMELSVRDILDSEEKRKEKNNNFIDDLMKNADPNKKPYIDALLQELLYPFIYSGTSNRVEINNKKRICSSEYFNKYFLYATPDDMISDQEAECFIKKLPTIDESDILKQFEFYYKQYGFDNIQRVIYDQILYPKYSKNIDNACIEKICIALARLSVNKSRTQYTMYNSKFHIEMTICEIIERYVNNLSNEQYMPQIIPDYSKQLEIIEKILSEGTLIPFHLFFATHFCNSCGSYYSTLPEIDEIIYRFIKRYIEQNGLGSLFRLGQTPTTVLFGIWKKVNPIEYAKIIDDYLSNGDVDMTLLIRSMIYNSHKEYYDKFCELFNSGIVYNKVKDIPVNNIPDYHANVGFFIRTYKSSLADEQK